MSRIKELTDALFAIYQRTGREVTYISERGEVRPYWANRFRQALQRAVDEDNIVGFVERLVSQPEPSRGFWYLEAADRLDLTVEALVVGDFRDLFSAEVVAVAEERLRDPGESPTRTFNAESPASNEVASTPVKTAGLRSGSKFTVEVTVQKDGSLSFSLG